MSQYLYSQAKNNKTAYNIVLPKAGRQYSVIKSFTKPGLRQYVNVIGHYMNPIENIISNALIPDIRITERAILLNRRIKEEQARQTTGPKADISLILYDLSYTELVMGLSRLYDSPNKKYPTRCLKSLYHFVDKNYECENFRKDVEYQIESFGFYPEFIELLLRSDDKQFIKYAKIHFETIEINDPIASAIDKLKNIRDKFLAHNEDIKLDTLFPYDDLEVLVSHAKKVVSFFALYFCNIHLLSNGNYYLSHSSNDWVNKYENFVNINGL